MSSSPARSLDQRLAALDLPANVVVGRVLTGSVRRLPSGIAMLDALLGGGWPVARITELSGPLAAGKTSLLAGALAAATRRSETTAYIDVHDSLDPVSLQRAGVDLRRVLWVRPGQPRAAAHCAELVLQAGGFALVILDFGAGSPRGLRSLVWPRLARAAERSRAALLIAAPYRLAGSFSTLNLQLRPLRSCWSPGIRPLFEGFKVEVTLARTKLGAPGRRAALQLDGGILHG